MNPMNLQRPSCTCCDRHRRVTSRCAASDMRRVCCVRNHFTNVWRRPWQRCVYHPPRSPGVLRGKPDQRHAAVRRGDGLPSCSVQPPLRRPGISFRPARSEERGRTNGTMLTAPKAPDHLRRRRLHARCGAAPIGQDPSVAVPIVLSLQAHVGDEGDHAKLALRVQGTATHRPGNGSALIGRSGCPAAV